MRAGEGRVVASHSAGEDYLVGMDVDGGFLLGKGDLELFLHRNAIVPGVAVREAAAGAGSSCIARSLDHDRLPDRFSDLQVSDGVTGDGQDVLLVCHDAGFTAQGLHFHSDGVGGEAGVGVHTAVRDGVDATDLASEEGQR